MENEDSIGISDASHFLGVSEVALRQWTDEGRIRAFITPGGHRRYFRNDLKKFISAQPKTLGLKDLVLEIEETTETHREIARKSLDSTAWKRKLTIESEAYFADQGRQLLSLIIRYISEPSKREETINLTRNIGRHMGETLGKNGLPLADSVEAFLAHREPVLAATTNLLKKKEAYTGRVVDAIPLAARVIDEALVALVSACSNIGTVLF